MIMPPHFSINYGVPLDPKATPNLHLYWPFWTNMAAPLVDMVGQVKIELEGVTLVSGLPQLYDDLSEVIANAARSPFDGFGTGHQSQAFAFIMNRIGRPAYTPASYRASYVNQSLEPNFAVQFAQIQATDYPGGAAFGPDEFDHVKTTLLQELSSVTEVWGYFESAKSNLPFVSQQFSLAAGNVYATAMASAVARDMDTSSKSSMDIGAAVNIVASLASLVPEYGKAVAAATKGSWAVISWFLPTPDANPSFDTTLQVEATAGTLAAAANAVTVGMISKLQNSISIILRDAGLLNTVGTRISQGLTFEFGIDLDPSKNPDLKNLDAVYAAAMMLMTQTLVCAAFPLYGIYCNALGGYAFPCNLVAADAFFGRVESQVTAFQPDPLNPGYAWWGGGIIVGTRNPHGHNGYPTYTSLPSTFAALINNAAAALHLPKITQKEIFTTWPFRKQITPAPPLPKPP